METVKTAGTYLIALVVIVGGGALLVIPTQVDSDALLPFLSGVVGAVIAYLFSREQTVQVQKGNGLERATLEAVHRRLDAFDAAQVAAQAAVAVGAAAAPVQAERMDVSADQVDVHAQAGPHG